MLSSSGAIYVDSGSYLQNFNWKSNLFDINLLGPELAGTQRFYIQRVFAKYNSTVSASINIYEPDRTGSLNIIASASLPTGSRYYSQRLPLGQNTKNFQLEITASTKTNESGSFKLQSAGVGFKILETGYRE
jgi:hypothetical protein